MLAKAENKERKREMERKNRKREIFESKKSKGGEGAMKRVNMTDNLALMDMGWEKNKGFTTKEKTTGAGTTPLSDEYILAWLKLRLHVCVCVCVKREKRGGEREKGFR